MLFMSPRGLSMSKIYKALPDTEKELVQIELAELVEEYNKRNGAIQIVVDNKKVEMVVKPEFSKFNIFAIGTKLKKSELKTLALISLNSPVEQAEVTKKRPFNDLKLLKDLNLIAVTKRGRKNILSTTKKFNILFNGKAKLK